MCIGADPVVVQGPDPHKNFTEIFNISKINTRSGIVKANSITLSSSLAGRRSPREPARELPIACELDSVTEFGKFHYAIKLASWFASWSATCFRLNSISRSQTWVTTCHRQVRTIATRTWL